MLRPCDRSVPEGLTQTRATAQNICVGLEVRFKQPLYFRAAYFFPDRFCREFRRSRRRREFARGKKMSECKHNAASIRRVCAHSTGEARHTPDCPLDGKMMDSNASTAFLVIRLSDRAILEPAKLGGESDGPNRKRRGKCRARNWKNISRYWVIMTLSWSVTRAITKHSP